MTHTRTPWQYTTNVGPTKALIVEPDGSTVIEVRRTVGDRFEANVAFIVRACNAHDALMSAMHMICNGYTTDIERKAIACAALAKAKE